MLSFVLALMLAPAVDPSTHWYVRQACAAFPTHECKEWSWSSARRCDAESTETCVAMWHPTVGGGGHLLGVYDVEGLAKMSIDKGGKWDTVYER